MGEILVASEGEIPQGVYRVRDGNRGEVVVLKCRRSDGGYRRGNGNRGEFCVFVSGAADCLQRRGNGKILAHEAAGYFIGCYGDNRALGIGGFFLFGFYGNLSALVVFEGNTRGEGGGVGPVQDILAEGNVLDAAVIREGGLSQGCYGIGNGERCETILGKGFFADGG